MQKILLSFVIFILAFSALFSQNSVVSAQGAVIDVSGGTVDQNPAPPLPEGDGPSGTGQSPIGAGTGTSGTGSGGTTPTMTAEQLRVRTQEINADRSLSPAQREAALAAAREEFRAATEARAREFDRRAEEVANMPEGPARQAAMSALAREQQGANLGSPVQNSCGFLNFECMLIRVIKWVALGILWLFSWLLMMAGGLFDYSIKYLVAGMGSLVVSGGFGGPIEDLWKLIRDLVNITFLFALIYIGLSTIVNGSSAGTKDKLKSVIISALLVNFSLYFAKVVIDISNLAATTIYNSLQGVGGGGQSISALFMNHLNLSALMLGDSAGDKHMEDLMEASTTSWEGLILVLIYAFGGSILMFKLTFAFALGAFLMTLRFIMLIVLMIFAPIAFLPSFLPGLGSYGKRWWDILLAQSFMAPLFLFGIFLTLKIISSIPGHTSGSLLTLFNDPSVSGGWEVGMRLLLFYIVAVVMIVGTTVMAKSMSSQAASFTTGATGWVDKKLKSGLNTVAVKPFTAGAKSTSSWAGRRSIGRLSNEFSKRADTNTWAGKLQRTNVLGIGRIARGVAKKGEENKFGGSYSYKDDKEWAEKTKQSQNKADRKDDRKKKLADYEQKKKEWEGMSLSEQHVLTGVKTALDEAKKVAQEEVQNMTLTELEGQSVAELKKIAGLLSTKQYEHIKDHKEKYTEGEKGDVKKARNEQHMLDFDADQDAFLKARKPADIAKLDKKILAKIDPQYLNGDVLRKIHDGAELSLADAGTLAKRIYAADTENAVAEANGRKAAKEAGKRLWVLPADATADEERKARSNPDLFVIKSPRKVDAAALKYLNSARGQGYYGRAPVDWNLADVNAPQARGENNDSGDEDDDETPGGAPRPSPNQPPVTPASQTEATNQVPAATQTSQELRRAQRGEDFQTNTASMRTEEEAYRRSHPQSSFNRAYQERQQATQQATATLGQIDQERQRLVAAEQQVRDRQNAARYNRSAGAVAPVNTADQIQQEREQSAQALDAVRSAARPWYKR